jgi:hypothetical protein
MPAPAKSNPLPLNSNPLNQAALEWLKTVKADVDPHYLHLLDLANWGLQVKVTGDWPDGKDYILEQQVDLMWAWPPADALRWLLSHPNEEDPEGLYLLQALDWASSPRAAASILLSHIYSRMQADVPALQPAASELS